MLWLIILGVFALVVATWTYKPAPIVELPAPPSDVAAGDPLDTSSAHIEVLTGDEGTPITTDAASASQIEMLESTSVALPEPVETEEPAAVFVDPRPTRLGLTLGLLQGAVASGNSLAPSLAITAQKLALQLNNIDLAEQLTDLQLALQDSVPTLTTLSLQADYWAGQPAPTVEVTPAAAKDAPWRALLGKLVTLRRVTTTTPADWPAAVDAMRHQLAAGNVAAAVTTLQTAPLADDPRLDNLRREAAHYQTLRAHLTGTLQLYQDAYLTTEAVRP